MPPGWGHCRVGTRTAVGSNLARTGRRRCVAMDWGNYSSWPAEQQHAVTRKRDVGDASRDLAGPGDRVLRRFSQREPSRWKKAVHIGNEQPPPDTARKMLVVAGVGRARALPDFALMVALRAGATWRQGRGAGEARPSQDHNHATASRATLRWISRRHDGKDGARYSPTREQSAWC